jgi:ankyrin repeat protein
MEGASNLGYLDAVQLLLEHGADPTIEGGKHTTALEVAKENE